MTLVIINTYRRFSQNSGKSLQLALYLENVFSKFREFEQALVNKKLMQIVTHNNMKLKRICNDNGIVIIDDIEAVSHNIILV